MNSKTTRQTHLSLWYTTAAVAAVGGLVCTANEAAAGIVSYTSGLAVPTSPSPPGLDDTTQGVWFNFQTGQNQTSNFTDAQFRLQWLQSSGNSYLYQFTAGNTLGLVTSFFFYPLKLNQGDNVGPVANCTASSQTCFAGFGTAALSAMSLVGDFPEAKWEHGDTGYLGLRFGSGSNYNYGWAEISIDANSANPGQPTLVAFGYETEFNKSIPAGATQSAPMPEPNPLLLLATGAAGLGAYRAWRARRGQCQTPDLTTA